MTIRNAALLLEMCTIPGTKLVPHNIASKILRMTDDENLVGENKETVADFIKFLIDNYQDRLSDQDFLHFFLGHWSFLQFLLECENKETSRPEEGVISKKSVSKHEDYPEDCPEDCENCIPSPDYVSDYIDRMARNGASLGDLGFTKFGESF